MPCVVASKVEVANNKNASKYFSNRKYTVHIIPPLVLSKCFKVYKLNIFGIIGKGFHPFIFWNHI